jgi:hypothetical protein
MDAGQPAVVAAKSNARTTQPTRLVHEVRGRMVTTVLEVLLGVITPPLDWHDRGPTPEREP